MNQARTPELAPIYLATGSHVAALDRITGTELWRTRLKSCGSTISLLVREGLIFAGSGGRVHCLDGLTGQVLWTNDLKGLGFGCVLFAVEDATGDAAAVAAVVAAQQAAAASAAATSG